MCVCGLWRVCVCVWIVEGVCVTHITHCTTQVEDHVVKGSKLKNETHVQQGRVIGTSVCLTPDL